MQKKNSNPFVNKAKLSGKKSTTGKRVGKSKPTKANNQRNRIVQEARGSFVIRDGRFVSER